MKKFTTLILIFFALNSFSEDLLALYKEALDKDPDFNSKKADLEISQEFLNQSRSLLLPQLRAVGGTNWNEYYQDRELENDYNTFSYGLNLSQPLFRLDTWFQTKQAKKNFQAAEARFAYQQQDLMIKVTQAYFKILSAQSSLKSAEATEKALENQYNTVLERFNVGAASRIELAESKSAYNQAQSNKVLASGNLEISFEELNSIVGRKITFVESLDQNFSFDVAPTDIEATS